MRLYYNIDTGEVATEDELLDESCADFSDLEYEEKREEEQYELQTKREYHGWIECFPSASIKNFLKDSASALFFQKNS